MGDENLVRIKKRTRGPIPFITSAVIAGGISILSLPVGIISWPLFYAFARWGIGQEIDEMMADNPEAIDDARKSASHRDRGDGVKVSATIGSNGALFNLPMTREYIVKDE